MAIHGYGWRKQQPDKRDLRFLPKDVPLPPSVDLRPLCPSIYDQQSWGSCFPSGTRIRMADGSHKPIEKITLLDRVVTAEGNVGTVTSTMVRGETNEVIALKLWGNNLLRMTREHPVLTTRGYVPANDLTLDDYVALPRYMSQATSVLEVPKQFNYNQSTGRIASTGNRSWAGVQGRTTLQVRVQPVPEYIPLSGAFGRIVGLFLAEGNTDTGKVVWTLGEDEEGTLVSELMMLLREELGLDPHRQKRGNGAIKVVVYGTAWVRLFEWLCGNGAGMKRISSAITSGPRDFQEAMLQGWLDGDGWHSKRGVSGVSISQDLALSMFDIANAVGFRPAINWSKAVQTHHVKIRQPRITVDLSSKDDNYRVQQTDTHMWRKVRAIEHEPFAGHVYNLSVPGDESYVAEGVGVHNCTSNAACGAFEFDLLKQGILDFMPSRMFEYYNTRVLDGDVTNDGGGTIRNANKALAKNGVCIESLWPYTDKDLLTKPPASVYAAALPDAIANYAAVLQDLYSMKLVLSNGLPIQIGFTVYDSFEGGTTAQDGIIPMPDVVREGILGGHAVLIVGFADTITFSGRSLTNQFICRNSWGVSWGNAGYFVIPYAYFIDPNLSSDLWVINAVPGSIIPTPPTPVPIEDCTQQFLDNIAAGMTPMKSLSQFFTCVYGGAGNVPAKLHKLKCK